ncbi:MAG: hypothetical protein AB7K52_10515 [Phycisphaerales bacterium]
MSLILLMTLLALGSLGPPGLLIAAAWRSSWPGARPSEIALAVGVSLPLLCLLEVYALGWLPVHRPLDWLPWLHALIALGSLAVVLAPRDPMRARAAAGWCFAGLTEFRSALARRPAARLLIVLGVALHLAVLLLAAFSAQWGGDAADYHLPQALQPWQDGRLGPVHASLVWADSYPRAGALLKFWLMALTRSDAAFNLSSYAMSWLFLLAACVAGRRLGLTRAASGVAAAAIPSAPIFSLLCTIGYVDLDFAAVLLAMAAFALPQRRTPLRAWGGPSLVACLLALVLAWWIKFAACAPIGLILLYRLGATLALRAPWPARRRAALILCSASAAALLIGSIPYIRAWIIYGTPTWPVELKLGPITFFEGPWPTAAVAPGHEHRLERFGIMWTNWFTPLNADSPGSLGPLFTVILLAPMLGVLVYAWGRRQRARGWPLAAILLLGILFLPQLHVPRYALYVLALGALPAAGLCFSRPGRWTTACLTVASGLVLLNTFLFGRALLATLHLDPSAADLANVSLLGTHRNRPLAIAHGTPDPRSPRLPALRAAWARVRPGETLVAAVICPTFYLYDLDYTIRVEHRPARPWPFGFEPLANLDHGRNEAPAWAARLRDERVAAVMVYAGSAEDRALASPSSGYERIYEQPPSAGAPIRVYARTPVP